MNEGEDSFAKAVYDFFEILADDVSSSSKCYSDILSLLNGYMPVMIDLIQSDRGMMIMMMMMMMIVPIITFIYHSHS